MNAWTTVFVACTDNERTTGRSWRSWLKLERQSDNSDMFRQRQFAVDHDAEVARVEHQGVTVDPVKTCTLLVMTFSPV